MVEHSHRFKCNQRGILSCEPEICTGPISTVNGQTQEKMKGQESASGSNTEETELDQLLQNILEEVDVAAESYDKENAETQEQIVKDCQNAEEVRRRALENLGQTQKRKKDDDEDSPGRKKRDSGSETLVYLKEKAERDFELKRERMKVKQQEMEIQKEQQVKVVESQQKMMEQIQAQQYSFQQQMIQ